MRMQQQPSKNDYLFLIS